MKAFIERIDAGGTNDCGVGCTFTENDGTFVDRPSSMPVSFAGITSDAGWNAAIIAAINLYASNHSYNLDGGIFWAFTTIQKLLAAVPAGLANAPQAAIANAPADATTNYNTITTLLGALTGAVNTANTKQNDIATRLNSLLSELRTLGLIAS